MSSEGTVVQEPKGFDDFNLRLGDMMRGERATKGKSLLDVQRELKIKAAYIAAIENADPTVFETPGFVAGYVRSYARYLGMDPEWAYRTFCAEGNFEAPAAADPTARRSTSKQLSKPVKSDKDPFADPNALFIPKGQGPFANVQPGALGSVAVLIALIGALGYGGWSVLQEVQKVRLTPVDQTPDVVAEVDPMAAPAAPESDTRAFSRIYRPDALETPVLVPRDGPIAATTPDRARELIALGKPPAGQEPPLPGLTTPEMPTATEISAGTQVASVGADVMELTGVDAALARALAGLPAPESDEAQALRVTGADAPHIELFIVREAWVRVRAADGTTLLEKLMQPGETFALPKTEEPAVLRAGNAGGVYFAVNGVPYGPAGGSGAVVGKFAMSPEALTALPLARAEEDADLAAMAEAAAAAPEEAAGEETEADATEREAGA